MLRTLATLALAATLIAPAEAAPSGDTIDPATYERAVERVRQKVRAGELTRTRADRITFALHARLEVPEPVERAEGSGVRARLERAVQEGSMSPQEARAKLAERDRTAETERRERAIRRMRAAFDPEAASSAPLVRVVQALEDGHLSTEQARTKFAQLRRGVGERTIRPGADSSPYGVAEFGRDVDRLWAAVDARDLTEARAIARTKTLRQKLVESRERQRLHETASR